MVGAFDFPLLEISRPYFEHGADEAAPAQARQPARVTGEPDPVLAHLAQALLPVLERPHEACTLFIDQMGLVICTHLISRYGGGAPADRRRSQRLSRQHAARAQELLGERLDGAVSIAEVAQACGLSRSHFTRAFRSTTGLAPYQWLQAQRIERACALLQQDARLSLVEIAAQCGFADQSHFTRTFTQLKGLPPGRWHRQARA